MHPLKSFDFRGAFHYSIEFYIIKVYLISKLSRQRVSAIFVCS